RGSTGGERQQIKWVARAVRFLLISFLLSTIAGTIGLDEHLIDTVVSGVAFIALPVSVAIAVLQYHLYDLDVVVKKALVAGALVLLVIGAYAAVVGLLGVVTSGNESSGSVFIVALVLGLAFRPVTRFARRLADRIVYGRRATPYEVLTEFSERVGESYATEDVLGRMAQILGQATGAGSPRGWVRLGAERAHGARARGRRRRGERGPPDDRGRDRRRGPGPGRAPRGAVGGDAAQRSDEPVEGTPRSRSRVAGGAGPSQRPARRGAARIAAATRQGAGPGAPQARAQHPRRGAAAAGRDVREDPSRVRSDGARSRPGGRDAHADRRRGPDGLG